MKPRRTGRGSFFRAASILPSSPAVADRFPDAGRARGRPGSAHPPAQERVLVTVVVDAMGDARIAAGDGIRIHYAIPGGAPADVVTGRGAAATPATPNTAMTARTTMTAIRTIGCMGRADGGLFCRRRRVPRLGEAHFRRKSLAALCVANTITPRCRRLGLRPRRGSQGGRAARARSRAACRRA